MGHEAPARRALLEECARTIERHERRALSARPLLPVLAWSALLLGCAGLGSGGPTPDAESVGWLVLLVALWLGCARLVGGPRWVGHLVGALLFVAVGAATLPLVEDAGTATRTVLLLLGWAFALTGAVVSTLRWVRGVRHDRAAALAAYSRRRDPTLRGDGDPTAGPQVATLFDLRRSPDFERSARVVVAHANAGLYSLRAVVPPAVLTLSGVLGLVLALVPLTDVGRAPWHWLTAASGLVLMAGYGYAMLGCTLGVVWPRQMEANRLAVEADVYGRQRALALDLPARPRPRLGLHGVAGLALASLLLVLLAARLRTTSGPAVAISLGLVLVAALVVAAWSRWRRAATRVHPLDGDGPGLLQGPGRAVVVRAIADGIEIAPTRPGPEPVRLAGHDVLGVLDVAWLHAFSGPGVALLTSGSPVVLVGGDVAAHPAVRALRRPEHAVGR